MCPQDISYSELFGAALEIPPGEFQDCYAFGLHKAGSSLLHKMIDEVCGIARIPALDIPDTLLRKGIFFQEWAGDRRLLEFIQRGRVYYGFREFPRILVDKSVHLETKKCVLLVRDPRDALVSQYFSFGGKYLSHALPSRNRDVVTGWARRTEHLSIDEYVLAASEGYLAKFATYQKQLCFENVLLRRYESIFFDKRTFLAEIFEHFGLNVDGSVLDLVAKRNDIRPSEENVIKHIRRGTPGDYIDKLRPETVSKLNNVFGEIGAWYGYDLR